MDRGKRRHTEKMLRKLMSKDGDNCSICRKPFPHNSRTFGGLTADDRVALACESCKSKVVQSVVSGIFVTRDFDPAIRTEGSRHTSHTHEEVEQAIKAMQSGYSGLDERRSEIARRAGVPGASLRSFTLHETPWKEDDAAWFKKNSARSHRLRPLLAGEMESFSTAKLPVPPDGHGYEVLIRQVEAGTRVRMPFCRNLSMPIPDIEAVLHALFDVAAGPGEAGRVISVQDVAQIALQHQSKLQ